MQSMGQGEEEEGAERNLFTAIKAFQRELGNWAGETLLTEPCGLRALIIFSFFYGIPQACSQASQ